MDRNLSNSAAANLPLCSFGPGGEYIVDWQVLDGDVSDARWKHPPRTLGSIVRRVAGWMLWDLKGWLIADHPGREYRADWKPEALEGCTMCGHSALWPRWFAQGKEGPEVMAIASVAESPKAAKESVIESPSTDEVPIIYRFPLDFHGNSELEPVKEFKQSPAGRLIARLSAESRDNETMNLFGDDVSQPLTSAEVMEASHDTDAETVSHSHRNPGLSGSQRVFADDAGARGPARRVKGNHLRARRGARKEAAHSAFPEQGSLFGDLADSEAA